MKGNYDKLSRCEVKNRTFGTDSNTWRACPLDAIIVLTRAFSPGQELEVYTAGTHVFGGPSAGWANVLPAPFGCFSNLGMCRRAAGLKSHFSFTPPIKMNDGECGLEVF